MRAQTKTQTESERLRGITGLLTNRIILDRSMSAGTRNAELGRVEGFTSAAVSLLLASLKAVLAIFSGSIALLADALNNFGDLAGSLVLIFGYRLSQKPRDEDHPYGHGRLRTVAGLILAIILIVVGVEAARSGVLRIIDPQPVVANNWVMAAVAASILLKVWLAYFARRIAQVTSDAALASEAWNHFFDIFSTGLVLVALFAARYDLPSIDGWAGIVISVFIILTGANYVRETANILIGKAPSEEDLKAVRRIALGFGEVESVHDIQIHEYGNMRLISLHAEMDGSASAIECHKLTERVEDRIAAHFDAKVIVHGDPVDLDHPDYKSLTRALNGLISETGEFVDFHDLRIEGTRPHLEVEVDIVTICTVGRREFASKADEVGRYLCAKIGGIERLNIGIETSYASDPEYRKTFPGDGS